MVADDHNDDQTKSFTALKTGTKITHYEIHNKIGSGGMGEVYLAHDSELDRDVALKFLPHHLCQDEDSRRRFKREAQAAAKLSHPNIVTIYDVGEYRSRPFFAMEHVIGQSLRDILASRSMDLSETIKQLIQVCEALSEAHQRGIIHRDIKPSNIVIDDNGRAKILDFGLAAIHGTEQITKSGVVLGTVGYIAPEIILGKTADKRSDIFSIGVLIYEMVTGIQPFMRDSEAATLHAIVYDAPVAAEELVESLPDSVIKIISKSMNKDPDNRYQSVDDLLADAIEVQKNIDDQKTVSNIKTKKTGFWDIFTKPLFTSLFIIMVIGSLLIVPSTRKNLIRWFTDEKIPDQIHLAVLPFTDMGTSNEERIYSDGLSDIISSKLTQLEKFSESMLVVPASEIRYRDILSGSQAREIFGVNLAIDGSIQCDDENIRMILNLIDTKTNRQLRSLILDLPYIDFVKFQDTTMVEIVNMLMLELNADEMNYINSDRTESSAAYDFYIRGKGYLYNSDIYQNIDTAIGNFREAIKIDSSYGLAYAGLGQAFWKKYKIDNANINKESALSNIQMALSINGKSSEAQVALGIIYNETGRSAEAAEVLNYAIELDSLNRAAYRELAQAMESLNMVDSAIAVYQRLIVVRPDYWSGYTDLGLFYANHGQYDDAVTILDLVSSQNFDGYDFLNNSGALYFSLGKYDKAQQMWEKSIKIKPNYGALTNLGTIHYLNDDFVKASLNYQQALEINDLDYKLWFNYSSSLSIQPGKKAEAKEFYLKGMKIAEEKLLINQNDHQLMAQMAEVYATIDNSQRAVELIEKALVIDTSNLDIKVSAAIVYELNGDRPKAIQIIVSVIEKGYPIEYLKKTHDLKNLMEDPLLDSLTN